MRAVPTASNGFIAATSRKPSAATMRPNRGTVSSPSLITAMSEGELTVPRFGRIVAADGFRLVAAMNPFDAVGTARISSAIYDRVCRITMGYQDAADEFDIVKLRAPAGSAVWRA